MTDSGPWSAPPAISQPQKARGRNWRFFFCWAAALLLFLGGSVSATGEASWINERISGFLLMLGSVLLAPPILEMVRRRFRLFRLAAMPVLYGILLLPLAIIAGQPFMPSAAEQLRLQTVAMARANEMLLAGDASQAKERLRRFDDKRSSNPKLAALFDRIDKAMTPKPTEEKPPAQEMTVAAKPAPTVSVPVPQAATTTESEVSLTLSGQVLLTSISALQERMNDPTSLLITGNKVLWERDIKEHPVLRNYVKHRGMNAFGGVVTERAIITLGPDGKTVIGVEKFPT